ncbi:hypothetical protein YB2330_005283 [Saitoella coloradoensis]
MYDLTTIPRRATSAIPEWAKLMATVFDQDALVFHEEDVLDMEGTLTDDDAYEEDNRGVHQLASFPCRGRTLSSSADDEPYGTYSTIDPLTGRRHLSFVDTNLIKMLHENEQRRLWEREQEVRERGDRMMWKEEFERKRGEGYGME